MGGLSTSGAGGGGGLARPPPPPKGMIDRPPKIVPTLTPGPGGDLGPKFSKIRKLEFWNQRVEGSEKVSLVMYLVKEKNLTIFNAQTYFRRLWCQNSFGRGAVRAPVTCPPPLPVRQPAPPPHSLFLGGHTTPCVTFRRVVAPLRGPGQSPVLPFACCVRSLLSVGRCGRCSCLCRFRVRGAQ